MKEELNLEQLLAADREHMQRATRQAIAGGLAQRVSAAKLAGREGLFAQYAQYLFAGVVASAAIVLIAVTVLHRNTDHSLPAPAATTVSRAVPPSTLIAPSIQRPLGVPAPSRAIARQRDKRPEIRHRAMPFPTPTPLSPEERTLVLIAQSSPREKLLIQSQQQQLSNDFVNGVRQFKEKIQQEEGKQR